MNIALSFCSLGNDCLLWAEGNWTAPFTTTPCPEPRPPKSPTWSSQKRSRPVSPPAPLEPPLWRTSGCTLKKTHKGDMGEKPAGAVETRQELIQEAQPSRQGSEVREIRKGEFGHLHFHDCRANSSATKNLWQRVLHPVFNAHFNCMHNLQSFHIAFHHLRSDSCSFKSRLSLSPLRRQRLNGRGRRISTNCCLSQKQSPYIWLTETHTIHIFWSRL